MPVDVNGNITSVNSTLDLPNLHDKLKDEEKDYIALERGGIAFIEAAKPNKEVELTKK